MEVAHQHKTDTGGHQATFRSIILKQQEQNIKYLATVKRKNGRSFGEKGVPSAKLAAAVSWKDFSCRIYLSADYFS